MFCTACISSNQQGGGRGEKKIPLRGLHGGGGRRSSAHFFVPLAFSSGAIARGEKRKVGNPRSALRSDRREKKKKKDARLNDFSDQLLCPGGGKKGKKKWISNRSPFSVA